MTAEEIRIGNFVYHNVDECNCEMTFELLKQTFNANDFNEYSPIILTEDWLKRAGFIDAKFRFGNAEELELDFDGDHYNIFYNQKNNDNTSEKILMYKELYYVHELQNLYYALTGSELSVFYRHL